MKEGSEAVDNEMNDSEEENSKKEDCEKLARRDETEGGWREKEPEGRG